MKIELKNPGILFDEEHHTYTRKRDGQLLPGVSTILNTKAADYLKFWTTKMNYEYMMKNWDLGKIYTQQEKEDLLLKAKNAHAVRSKGAANKGSLAHKWIEDYIKKKNPILPTDVEVMNCVTAFLEWEQQTKVVWLISELLVASEKYSYCGTLDALGVIENKLVLIDFKTSNQISEEYFLQTAGYQIALEEMGAVPDSRLILRFPKNGKGFEALTIKSDLNFDKEVFLYLREVHKWNIFIESRREELGLKKY